MSERPPAVTVVVPCHDLGAWVDQAVQSVLDQTYSDHEVLVIDDGSTDEATRLLFASYRRPRTRVLRTENQGLARTRNLGLREARGRYVSFLDADDLLEPTFLEKTVAELDADPGLAFASCWLRGFGELEFDWRPAACAFPRLLAECTFCTAALLRKDVVVAEGGFDAAMPLAGYEDWDLAITLLERGRRGTVVPESLFRYRIRSGSMSASCTAPANHARLFRYIVDKHAATYRAHAERVLAEIEARVADVERHPVLAPRGEKAGDDPERFASALRDGALAMAFSSRSWSLTSGIRALSRSAWRKRSPAPELTVVVPCRDSGASLARTAASIFAEGSRSELLIVDDGSTDPATLALLEACAVSGAWILRTRGLGLAAALRAGAEAARGPVVTSLDPGMTVNPGALGGMLQALAESPAADFVVGGLRDLRTGFVWSPAGGGAAAMLGSAALPFPVARRTPLLRAMRDASGETLAGARLDTLVRLAQAGPWVAVGSTFDAPRVERPPAADSAAAHPALFEASWRDILLAREDQRRRLEARVEELAGRQAASAADDRSIEWGSLRRTEPVSRVWGLERGQPIDRHAIDRFLERHRAAIRGRVLEVKDPVYTRAFGSGVTTSDVVDIAADNPDATLVADLARLGSLPAGAYDCVLLTQTLHIIYDVRSVLANVARALRPGGVLLATLPCVSRLDYESGLDGDFWRFTPASARRLFEEAFGPGNVEVAAAGNVLTCSAFLMGLAASDLRSEELERDDPYFPLLVGVRAVKRAEPASRDAASGARAVILMYHRVARVERDRWGLSVSPERFEDQLRVLGERFRLLPLSELARALRMGELPDESVVVTFDDGYLDNATEAEPLLRRYGVPASFFVTTGGLPEGAPFWWDVLEAADLPEEQVDAVHARLMDASEDVRRASLAELPPGRRTPPERMSLHHLEELARDPLFEIGSHSVTHRALPELPPWEQRAELRGSIAFLAHAGARAVRTFAYPFGRHSGQTARLLASEGVLAACTVEEAAVDEASDPLGLPRMRVGNWSGAELEARIRAIRSAP